MTNEAKSLQIMQHTIGVDQYGRGEQYRNHFVTGEGSDDFDTCNQLVNKGLMAVRRNHPLSGGDDCFWLTDAGKQFVAEHSPEHPRISRGKARYGRYLEYGDSFHSFKDFLYWDAHPERSWNANKRAH